MGWWGLVVDYILVGVGRRNEAVLDSKLAVWWFVGREPHVAGRALIP